MRAHDLKLDLPLDIVRQVNHHMGGQLESLRAGNSLVEDMQARLTVVVQLGCKEIRDVFAFSQYSRVKLRIQRCLSPMNRQIG